MNQNVHEPITAQTKNSRNQKEHQPKNSTNQKELEPKTAETERSGTKKNTNQKGHEPKRARTKIHLGALQTTVLRIGAVRTCLRTLHIKPKKVVLPFLSQDHRQDSSM